MSVLSISRIPFCILHFDVGRQLRVDLVSECSNCDTIRRADIHHFAVSSRCGWQGPADFEFISDIGETPVCVLSPWTVGTSSFIHRDTKFEIAMFGRVRQQQFDILS